MAAECQVVFIVIAKLKVIKYLLNAQIAVHGYIKDVPE